MTMNKKLEKVMGYAVIGLSVPAGFIVFGIFVLYFLIAGFHFGAVVIGHIFGIVVSCFLLRKGMLLVGM